MSNTAAAGGTMQAMFYTEVLPGEQAGPLVAPRPQAAATPNALQTDGPKLCGYISPEPEQWEIDFLAQIGVTVR